MVRLEVVEVVVATEEEEVKVEDKVEEAEEQAEVEVDKETMVKEETGQVQGQGQAQATLVTRLRDMLISHQLKPASGTGHTENRLIFVWSPPPAPGKTSGSPSQTTEGPTSPAKRQMTIKIHMKRFTNFYTLTIFQK